jgi:ribonuclease HI
MDHVLVFTDGAAKGNPGPGGFGVVIKKGDTITEVGGGSAHTTNNEMELRAAVEAIRALKGSKLPIHMYTDSKYVAQGAEQWIFGWLKNEWKTKTGTEVRNKALWQTLVTLLKSVRVKWHVLPGHVGIVGNERADTIASAYALGKRPALYHGPSDAYGFDITNVAYDVEKKDARSSARKRQSQKAHSYISLRDGKVMVHATWAECEARVKGRSGVRFKKSVSADDERTIINEFRGKK